MLCEVFSMRRFAGWAKLRIGLGHFLDPTVGVRRAESAAPMPQIGRFSRRVTGCLKQEVDAERQRYHLLSVAAPWAAAGTSCGRGTVAQS